MDEILAHLHSALDHLKECDKAKLVALDHALLKTTTYIPQGVDCTVAEVQQELENLVKKLALVAQALESLT